MGSDQAAAWFCDLIALYTSAVAVEETIWVARAERAAAGAGAEPDRDAVEDRLSSYLESLPVDQFPLLTSLARALTAGGSDERFEFGLTVLVAGLKSLSR